MSRDISSREFNFCAKHLFLTDGFRWHLLFTIIVLLLTLFSPSYCGKYVAEFLEVGIGVRAAGLGGAYVAAGDDASAFWWNPACVAWNNIPQIYMMHSAMYDNMYQLDAVAYKDKLFGTYLAASFLRLGTDQIPFTREDGFYDYGPDGVPGTGDEGEGNGVWDPGEPVDASAVDMRSEGDYAVIAGAAFPVSKCLAWGLSAKIIHQNIGGYKNIGFGADIGIRFKLSQRLMLGMSVLDVTGTHISWNTGFSESKLPSMRAGAAYEIALKRDDAISLLLTGDIEVRFEGAAESAIIAIDPISIDPHIGAELSLWHHFFPRIGFDRDQFTTGAGLKISRFSLDYAFVMSTIDYVHRVSLTIDFNPRLPPSVQQPLKS